MQIRRRPPSPPLSVHSAQFQTKATDATPQNILEEIVWHKETEVARRREQLPLVELQRQVLNVPPPRDFVAALRQSSRRPALIAEVKKASPSKGVLRQDFQPVAIAQNYAAVGAACLSVLTDEKFFQGSFDYLDQIRQSVQLPLLCKDFILYPYQMYLARTKGADAILLIAAILSDQDLSYFLKIAKALGMAALVEVHTLAELERVLQLEDATLVGINNRNLETFTVDLQTTCQLLAQHRTTLAERNMLVVSESGLHTAADLQQVATAGAGAVLIGEYLMQQRQPLSPTDELTQIQQKIADLYPLN